MWLVAAFVGWTIIVTGVNTLPTGQRNGVDRFSLRTHTHTAVIRCSRSNLLTKIRRMFTTPNKRCKLSEIQANAVSVVKLVERMKKILTYRFQAQNPLLFSTLLIINVHFFMIEAVFYFCNSVFIKIKKNTRKREVENKRYYFLFSSFQFICLLFF